jgi:hypothetical protein
MTQDAAGADGWLVLYGIFESNTPVLRKSISVEVDLLHRSQIDRKEKIRYRAGKVVEVRTFQLIYNNTQHGEEGGLAESYYAAVLALLVLHVEDVEGHYERSVH